MIKTAIGGGDNAVYWGPTYINKDLSSMTCYRDGQNGTALDFLCAGY